MLHQFLMDAVRHSFNTFITFFVALVSSLPAWDSAQSDIMTMTIPITLVPIIKMAIETSKKASTIVSNHCSVNDCLILICKVCPGFCPTIGFKKVPIFNTTIEVLDSFYIDRAGD